MGGVFATWYACGIGFLWGAVSSKVVVVAGVSGDAGGAWLCVAGMGAEEKDEGGRMRDAEDSAAGSMGVEG